MGFYKKSIHNRFFDLAKGSIKEAMLRFTPMMINEDEEPEAIEFGEVEEQATINLLIDQAPAEIKSVFNLLFNAPDEVLESIGIGCKTGRGHRHFSNKILCEMLGYNPRQVNLVEDIKSYLLEA